MCHRYLWVRLQALPLSKSLWSTTILCTRMRSAWVSQLPTTRAVWMSKAGPLLYPVSTGCGHQRCYRPVQSRPMVSAPRGKPRHSINSGNKFGQRAWCGQGNIMFWLASRYCHIHPPKGRDGSWDKRWSPTMPRWPKQPSSVPSLNTVIVSCQL